MKKYLIFFAAMLLGITACDKKHKTPEEYFSFDANGVHYEYPQESDIGWLGETKTLFAGAQSGNLGYTIAGSSWKNPTAPGTITFTFSNTDFPTQDTIILNANGDYASIKWFLEQGTYYYTGNLQVGKVIFSERSNTKLTGVFEFYAKEQTTGEILHITNGKFSIIPSN